MAISKRRSCKERECSARRSEIKVYLSKALLQVLSLSARLVKVPLLVLRLAVTRPLPSHEMESTTKARHFLRALGEESSNLTLAL